MTLCRDVFLAASRILKGLHDELAGFGAVDGNVWPEVMDVGGMVNVGMGNQYRVNRGRLLVIAKVCVPRIISSVQAPDPWQKAKLHEVAHAVEASGLEKFRIIVIDLAHLHPKV